MVIEAIIKLDLMMFLEFHDEDQEVSFLKSKFMNVDLQSSNRKLQMEEIFSLLRQSGLMEKFFNFIDQLGKKSENLFFLNCYAFEDGAALLSLLQSIQTGDFEARMAALKSMGSMFFSFDSINYKRWTVIELAYKESVYPKDLLDIFQNNGTWRENFTLNKGSYMPSDMAHEVEFNHRIKSAIVKNRQNYCIIENICRWLPIRMKILKNFCDFVNPTKKTPNKKENMKENERYNIRLDEAYGLLAENFEIKYENFHDPDFKKTLVSLSGLELDIKAKERLLKSTALGREAMAEFAEQRIINKEKEVRAPIKKMKIETFPYLDEGNSKKKKKSSKDEIKSFIKLEAINKERKVIENNHLFRYQLSQENALCQIIDKELIPNIRGDKSSAINDFVYKVAPECFQNYNKYETQITVVEGENCIYVQPTKSKSIEEHCKFIFIHKIKPFFKYCSTLMIIFDDNKLGNFDLKKTEGKRYKSHIPNLKLTKDFLIEDWQSITRSSQNKQQFKKILSEVIIENANELLAKNQKIYINGCNSEDGTVYCVEKNSEGFLNGQLMPNWELKCKETDSKIFDAIAYLSGNNKKSFLVYSLGKNFLYSKNLHFL